MIEKLYPVFKDNLWGGERLPERYGKVTDIRPCAESWELSMHPSGESAFADGRLLSEAVGERELGKNAAAFEKFPMLIKFIDAKENLSVQVHPSDDYALKNENSYGKTELWYIVEADEGAGIYLGLRKKYSENEVRTAIADGALTKLLNFYPVKSGDAFFIPSGTVHAIGAGCLIAEIQQSSDITYRVYDYLRRDKNGNLRELHIEAAMRVANLTKYEQKALPRGILGLSKYFTSHILDVAGEATLSPDTGSFISVSCVAGGGRISGAAIAAGDSYFISADEGDVVLSGNMRLLVSEVRRYHVEYRDSSALLVDDKGNCISSAEAECATEAKQKLLSSLYMTESDLCEA